MPNHLADETSPYLLQHVDNPVDWYPWGEQALALAREQNKPILLSIGYSACHWCHVMAHESFEDAEIAAAMNQHFINIKVDREERPDIDQIYQTVYNMLNHRSGGWPLTMFLTPAQKPFFGGTYFPKTARHGLPGFLDLLPYVAEVYHTKGEAIEKQSQALSGLLADALPVKSASPSELTDQHFQIALDELKRLFDSEHGGLGDAPKFIHPAELAFCLQQYHTTQDKNALQIVTLTLQKMAEGGIYDQLGGGFCRYSTDNIWDIPHFEKMLYDNGPLLQLLSDAWLVTDKPIFKRVVAETAAWVMREMQSPHAAEGGYYSTLDADSEQEEGKFYVWQRDQIKEILSAEEYAVFAPHLGLQQPANFEDRAWNLNITESISDVAQTLAIDATQAEQHVAHAKAKLFAVREQRIHPGRDEKILVSWNGLMVKGMVRAGRVFENPLWVQSAIRAVDFIRTTLWQNNRLFATYKDDKAHLNAYLDDYAFLLDGLLELMRTEFRQVDLDFAIRLVDVLLDQFEDKTQGGFFFTSHDHEQLIHRPKPAYDNATPSGNGIAASALYRLGELVGDYRYCQAAENAIQLFAKQVENHPSAYCSLLTAQESILSPQQMIVLRGDQESCAKWQAAMQSHAPEIPVYAVPKELTDLPVGLNKPVPADRDQHAVSAWVCQNTSCLPEITTLQELLQVCPVQGKIVIRH